MTSAPTIFALDLPEFSPVVAGAKAAGCDVSGPMQGYWIVRGNPAIHLRRKELGLSPALWNTALAGGTRGKVIRFDAVELIMGGQTT